MHINTRICTDSLLNSNIVYVLSSTGSAGLELLCLSDCSFSACLSSFVCMCETKTYTFTEPFVKISSNCVATRHSSMANHSAAVVKLGLARCSRVEHSALDVDTVCARGVELYKAPLHLNSSALCARDRGEIKL